MLASSGLVKDSVAPKVPSSRSAAMTSSQAVAGSLCASCRLLPLTRAKLPLFGAASRAVTFTAGAVGVVAGAVGAGGGAWRCQSGRLVSSLSTFASTIRTASRSWGSDRSAGSTVRIAPTMYPASSRARAGPRRAH